MGFGAPPLVTPEHIAKLEEELSWAWDEGWNAKKIVKELGFGVRPEYARLREEHVYYFADKFKLRKRFRQRQPKKIDSRFKNYYAEYTPDMPPHVAENLRQYGFLLNDPQEGLSKRERLIAKEKSLSRCERESPDALALG